MMNSGPLLFLGVFFTMSVSWLGMIFFPVAQLGGAQQAATDTGLYPSRRPGLAAQGAEVYRANGCYVCHSQQVSHPGYGGDAERGWGRRRTVAQDYIWDNPVMLGDARIGPDLANAGLRETNLVAILAHIYNPKTASPSSLMPGYPYLFENRRIEGAASPEALPLAGPHAPAQGYEIVPKPQALQLAAYLVSLRSEEWLFETPAPPKPKTNAAPESVPALSPTPVKGSNPSAK
jgi:cytochrome c oxidase cbb3-type subunit 2